ncbi:hypothetical protein FIBSPDRAFT_966682 [Athelia psychrophila]|uniref:Uncharacterized protein n=1 Tax=Athelia psychrophila TaxID=1759441 RepID=A0A167WJP5_9AGAM|nr:hypothetical protein FIBSPDRAFT_966682 [Fibularhizoctonia sp. CBS 109695]
MDDAVKYLLRVHDVAILNIALETLLMEDLHVDFKEGSEKKAVTIGIEQRHCRYARGKTSPIQISWGSYTVLVKEAARAAMGDGDSLFENPDDRKASNLPLQGSYLAYEMGRDGNS